MGARGVVETDVPVLFLNGAADPVDPPENVAAEASWKPRATLVAVPGEGTACCGSRACWG